MSGELGSLSRMDAASGDGFRKKEFSARSLGNGRQSPTSPLKLFGQAKGKINNIYQEIASYVEESNNFLHGVSNEEEIVSQELLEKTENFIDKVAGIKEIIGRDRMKVAFFGRTSNGKSTVINAMLKSKILPSGIGHTTNCFLQVEGSDESKALIYIDDQEEAMNIQNISQLASALSKAKLDHNSMIRICWPKNECSLLRDDVVLVDSPGVDVTPDLDKWIDDYCMDADVFVLVANAESTLMTTEKKFFHKVSSKLSKPNVFVLNNRWDASASEPEMMEEVKQQHMERNIEFLVDELKVMEKHEAEDRVYFVSAREVLVHRVNHGKSGLTPSSQLLEGHLERLMAFATFETKFQETISQSAVQTKFAQHTGNGKQITGELRDIMDNVHSSAVTKRTECSQDLREAQDRLDFVDKQLNLLTLEIKDKIRQMVEEVDRKVASSFTEEIRRLALLVDEFERPFHPDNMLLNVYKKEMHDYVADGLSRGIQDRCSLGVKTAVEACQQDMEERLAQLLPDGAIQQSNSMLPTRDFEPAYRLDCKNLCADFQEDIQFRFSLGITSLMHRFLGHKGTQSVLMAHSDTIPRPMAMTPQTPSNEAPSIAEAAQDQQMLVAVLAQFTSLYSRTTVGALAITGLVAKAAGWRVIAVCGAIYGLLYVYERLTWTNKAKERAFKRQYVDYATGKLRLIVGMTSANCSHQVQQELSATFARLCRLVDNNKSDLHEDIKKYKEEMSTLEQISGKSNFLKNKAGYLDSELDTFIRQYLKSECRL